MEYAFQECAPMVKSVCLVLRIVPVEDAGRNVRDLLLDNEGESPYLSATRQAALWDPAEHPLILFLLGRRNFLS